MKRFTRSVMFTLFAIVGLAFLPEVASAQIVQPAFVVATDCKRTATQTASQTVYLTVNQLGQLCTVNAPTTISSGMTAFDLNTLTTVGGKASNITTSAGQIYALSISPLLISTTGWINIYDALAVNVTPGTTTPLLSFQLPAAVLNIGTTFTPVPWVSPIGIPFGTALSASCTTTQGGSTTLSTTNPCRVFGLRK